MKISFIILWLTSGCLYGISDLLTKLSPNFLTVKLNGFLVSAHGMVRARMYKEAGIKTRNELRDLGTKIHSDMLYDSFLELLQKKEQSGHSEQLEREVDTEILIAFESLKLYENYDVMRLLLNKMDTDLFPPKVLLGIGIQTSCLEPVNEAHFSYLKRVFDTMVDQHGWDRYCRDFFYKTIKETAT